MDAIALLRDDHRTVEKLFKKFEKAGDNAYATKRRIGEQIVEELSRHADVEEQLFYPVSRATVPGTEDIALESLEEHHVVKWVLNELDGMDPKDERYTAKMTVLMENVRHHVAEEEQEFFPKVRNRLTRSQLQDLGEAMEKAKKAAPTHPHPRSPDTPPGKIVAGAVAGVVDKARDVAGGVAQGTVSAAQEFIDRVIGDGSNGSSAPTGNTTQRRTARKTQAAARDVTKRASAAGKRAAKKASSGTRKASGSAKKTGGRASASAKKAAGRATGSAKKTARKASGSAKKTARKATGSAKKTARKATGSTKKTARKATGSTKKTARKAAGSTKKTAKRASGSAKKTAKRASGSAKKTAKKASGRSR